MTEQSRAFSANRELSDTVSDFLFAIKFGLGFEENC